MRVWVTRAEPGAAATAARLAALGHEAVVAPLLRIRPLETALDLDAVGALAFTSAAGVLRFAALSPVRDLPAFAVGDATAVIARGQGFTDVRSADGDVVALARLVAGAQPDGTVLHLGAREPAGDLVGLLTQADVPARFQAVYETLTVTRLPALDRVEAVTIHSPKAARTLAALAPPELRSVRVLALSPACAAPLREAGFTRVDAAEAPREEALLGLLR